jgi:hypothetical protein
MASLVNVKSPDKSGVYVPVANNVRQEQVQSMVAVMWRNAFVL